MIVFLPGRITCPLAGVGTRTLDHSNRLVVDDPATASISGSTITLYDDRDCTPNTTIADLVWLAEGPEPFTIHLEVTKTGHDWAIELHTHEPVKLTDRSRARYEPFEIVAMDGDRRRVLVDRKRLEDAVQHVPLGRRLAARLTAVKDHVAGAPPDTRVFDRSIGIGAFGAGSYLVRATLTSRAPHGDLASKLRDNSWELSITGLTDRWLPEIVARDLVLFGLDGAPFAPKRFGKGSVLAFDPTLPRALDVAREYLEFHMLGGMIAAAVK